MRKSYLLFFLLIISITISGCVTGKKAVLRKRKKISSVLRLHLPDIAHRDVMQFWEGCGFDDTNRLVHFLGQCAHESDNFVYSKELLRFALNKEHLFRLFSNRLLGKEDTIDSYFDKFNKEEMDAEELKLLVAELVYGQREDLGNLNHGDGSRFIGRGYIQLTGRDNYATFTNFLVENLDVICFNEIDCITNPELVASKFPMLSAIWYFHHKDLFKICSKGLHRDVIREITVRVNGSTNGLKNRIKWTRYYEKLLKKYL